MRLFLFFIILFICPLSLHAQESRSILENSIAQIITFLRLKPLDKPKEVDWNLYRFGEKLFFEKELSGNRNISCASCHRVDKYSGDGLALGIGEGAKFGLKMHLAEGGILKRHTPVLINLGYTGIKKMFWDGRLSLRASGWNSPEEGINGSSPLYPEIANNFSSALSAQAAFPLVSNAEMLGQPGDNEIADETENVKRWELIVGRVLSSKLSRKYKAAIKKSYPKIKREDLNISHLTNALAEYMTHFFSSYNTPYDEYLRGDESALDVQALKGMELFFQKARCALCHNGGHLTNFQFMSSGAPQIDRLGSETDFGRAEASLRNRDQFLFKVPQLRNIALTAPYMHSGGIKTLEGVVEHYNNVETGIRSYSLTEELNDFYKSGVLVDEDPDRNKLRYLQVRLTPFLVGLKLTEEEKEDLVYFLREGLTDPIFKKRLDDQGQKIKH